MKKLMIMMAVTGLVVGAHADITQFNWVGSLEDASGVEPAAFATTAFTYTSADTVRDLLLDGAGDLDIANLVSSVGNDLLWGDTSVDILPIFLGGGFLAGVVDTEVIADRYAYAFIFDGVFTDISEVTKGTKFGLIDVSAAYKINNLGATPAPSDIQEFDAGLVKMTGTVVAIPEPATLGLMGIAGLGMFLARKKARR